MQYFKLKLKNGFTLIELLVVIAIIGILAVGIISLMDPVTQFQKARDSVRKSDLSQIQKALETFYQDNGRYPNAISFKIQSTKDTGAADWGTNRWAPYMEKLPADPKTPAKKYVYVNSESGQTYYLYANLENKNDSQLCFAGGTTKCDNAPSDSDCGTGAVCNYGISSPNAHP